MLPVLFLFLAPWPQLIQHQSDTPVLLGRYALDYAGFLLIFAALTVSWAILSFGIHVTQWRTALTDFINNHPAVRWLGISLVVVGTMLFAYLLRNRSPGQYPLIFAGPLAVLAILFLTQIAPLLLIPMQQAVASLSPYRIHLVYLFILISVAYPVFRITLHLSMYGEDILTNDYIGRVAVLRSVLSPGADWRQVFRLSVSKNGHVLLVALAYQALAAALADLSTKFMIYTGLLLNALKLTLLYAMVRKSAPPQQFSRQLLLSLIAALLFSFTQLDALGFGDVIGSLLLSQTLAILSLWIFTRSSQTRNGVGVGLLFAIAATWTNGLGLSVWPALFLAVILIGPHRVTDYLLWLMGAAIAVTPYLWYRVIDPVPLSDTGGFSLNGIAFLNGLALPLVSGFYPTPPQLTWIGLLAILLLVALALAVSRLPQRHRPRIYPALLLIVFGLTGVGLIATTRGTVASWYTPIALPYWAGLLGLAAASWQSEKRLPRFTAFTTLAVVVGLFTISNATDTNKIFLLRSRAPLSVSCVAHYPTAPTTCQSAVFQWGAEAGYWQVPTLGWYLEDLQLSVFGAATIAPLQGDFAFNRVTPTYPTPTSDIFWVNARNNRTDWRDYHRLTLALDRNATLTWQVDLTNISTAHLRTRLSPGSQITLTPEDPSLPPIIITHAASETHPRRINLNLADFTGQAITLDFQPTADSDTARFYYPYVNVTTVPRTEPLPPLAELDIRPENTSLSPVFPAQTANDLPLNLSDSAQWNWNGLEYTPLTQRWSVVASPPWFSRREPLSICLRDYSHLVWEMSPGSDIRRVTVNFLLSNQSIVSIPTDPMPDNVLSYSIDLDWLTAPPNTHLSDLHLHITPNQSEDATFYLNNLRLIHAGYDATQCTSSPP